MIGKLLCWVGLHDYKVKIVSDIMYTSKVQRAIEQCSRCGVKRDDDYENSIIASVDMATGRLEKITRCDNCGSIQSIKTEESEAANDK